MLYNPENGEAIWQWAEFSTARQTESGWCIDVPSTKRFGAESTSELNDEVWDDDGAALRRRFAIDREFMKLFEAQEAFVRIDKWLNKSLQYREIEIRFEDPSKQYADYSIPISATWHFEVDDLMRHFLPWLDFDYYEEPDDGGHRRGGKPRHGGLAV